MNKIFFAIACAALLGGCGTPQPAPRLYELRAAPPVTVQPVASTQVVQLLSPVRLPELLERDALLMPQGQAGLEALQGHRWAEPLRDAVPRLLRQDLATLLGEARVWSAPLPAGVAPTRLLRVDVLVLAGDIDLAIGDHTAPRIEPLWPPTEPVQLLRGPAPAVPPRAIGPSQPPPQSPAPAPLPQPQPRAHPHSHPPMAMVPMSPPPPLPPMATPAAPPRRRRGWIVGAVALLAIGGGAAALVATRATSTGVKWTRALAHSASVRAIAIGSEKWLMRSRAKPATA